MLKNNLKEIREKEGISQRELARRIGMSGQMISKIERGEAIPSLETINKIAAALGTTIDGLVSYEEHRNKELSEQLEKIISKFPQYKGEILDIKSNADRILEAEFIKPHRSKSSAIMHETIENNLTLYNRLFTCIYELSNIDFAMSDYKKEDYPIVIPFIYSRKDKKKQEISNILDEIFHNYLKRYGIGE